jgi:hypothetical protein
VNKCFLFLLFIPSTIFALIGWFEPGLGVTNPSQGYTQSFYSLSYQNRLDYTDEKWSSGSDQLNQRVFLHTDYTYLTGVFFNQEKDEQTIVFEDIFNIKLQNTKNNVSTSLLFNSNLINGRAGFLYNADINRGLVKIDLNSTFNSYLTVGYFDKSKLGKFTADFEDNSDRLYPFYTNYFKKDYGTKLRVTISDYLNLNYSSNIDYSFSSYTSNHDPFLDVDLSGHKDAFTSEIGFYDVDIVAGMTWSNLDGQLNFYEYSDTRSGYLNTSINQNSWNISIKKTSFKRFPQVEFGKKQFQFDELKIVKLNSGVLWSDIAGQYFYESDDLSLEFSYVDLKWNTSKWACVFGGGRINFYGEFDEFQTLIFKEKLRTQDTTLKSVDVAYLKINRIYRFNKRLQFEVGGSQFLPFNVTYIDSNLNSGEGSSSDNGTTVEDLFNSWGGTLFEATIFIFF